MKITVEHARAVLGFSKRKGYCAKGMRRFAKRYGLDYGKFLKEGIDEEELLATGDAMAKACVEQANGKG